MEKFIDGLRQTQVQLEVRRAQPQTLDEAYQAAVQEYGVLLEQTRAAKAVNGGSVKAVGGTGEATDATVTTLTQTGNSRGQRRGRSSRGRGRGARSRSNVRFMPTPGACFNCNEIGHQSSECTKPPQDKRCWNCGKTGHLRSECRTRDRGRGRGGRGGGSRGRGYSRGGRGGGQVRKVEETTIQRPKEEANQASSIPIDEAKN